MSAIDARTVKDALRRRHPAQFPGVEVRAPGPWTCLEEWCGIDLIAFAAWSKPKPARCAGARIGYEVKVSRADYRRELLKPSKRKVAIALCHEFYFAVPEGLLKPDEIAFEEPDEVNGQLFMREPCPGRCIRGKVRDRLIGPVVKPYGYDRDHEWYHRYAQLHRPTVDYPCPDCGGNGYLAKSVVETTWPTLWVPNDVGLVTISARGCRVVRKAPLNDHPKPIDGRNLGELVRWASFRPDPRHLVAIDAQDVAA